MTNGLQVIAGIVLLPFIVYFCVKFGTIAFYKAKEYIEKEKENY